MKELSHTVDEKASVLLEAVEWMQFTTCNRKITSVDVVFVPVEQPGEICPLVVSFLGTRCKNWGWEGGFKTCETTVWLALRET